jgi:hypothetical protein
LLRRVVSLAAGGARGFSFNFVGCGRRVQYVRYVACRNSSVLHFRGRQGHRR